DRIDALRRAQVTLVSLSPRKEAAPENGVVVLVEHSFEVNAELVMLLVRHQAPAQGIQKALIGGGAELPLTRSERFVRLYRRAWSLRGYAGEGRSRWLGGWNAGVWVPPAGPGHARPTGSSAGNIRA